MQQSRASVSPWRGRICLLVIAPATEAMIVGNLRPNQRNKYRAHWEFARGIADVKSTPVNLQIARSNTCNFKCVYCIDHRMGNNIPRTQLDGDVWQRLTALIPRCESLAFHGVSEFMVDRDFFSIIDRCAAASSELSINTNGSVCTPKHVDALREYPGYLMMNFSLDAVRPETFLRIRGWDFRRVVRNIRTYVRSFETRRDKTWITLSFVIIKSNVADMVPMVFLAKELNIDALKFYRLHEYEALDWVVETRSGGLFDYRKECTGAFSEEYNRAIARSREAADFLGIRVELPAAFVAPKLQSRTA
jgi:molybdenum cofactor biosynthesis enzyme MoaA